MAWDDGPLQGEEASYWNMQFIPGFPIDDQQSSPERKQELMSRVRKDGHMGRQSRTAVELLRARAKSYDQDVSWLTHEWQQKNPEIKYPDIAMLTTLRDELLKIATEVEHNAS
jgi:uncharacterized protein YoaH (UPF0181 family)